MKININEIDTSTCLTLDSVYSDEPLLGYINGKYYLLAGKIKEDVDDDSIIHASNEEEMYAKVLKRLLREPLNPYRLFLLLKKHKGLLDAFPKLKTIIKEALDSKLITDELIKKLDEHLLSFKNVIVVDPTILKAIVKILKYFEKKGIKDKEDKLLELISKATTIYYDRVEYPTARELYVFVLKYEKMKEDEEKIKKKIEELKAKEAERKATITIPQTDESYSDTNYEEKPEITRVPTYEIEVENEEIQTPTRVHTKLHSSEAIEALEADKPSRARVVIEDRYDVLIDLLKNYDGEAELDYEV